MLLNRNDQRARRAARRVGLRAIKSRSRNPLYRGAFMIVDPSTGFPIAGFNYDLSAEGVIDFCK
jgi:hypothetical protein